MNRRWLALLLLLAMSLGASIALPIAHAAAPTSAEEPAPLSMAVFQEARPAKKVEPTVARLEPESSSSKSRAAVPRSIADATAAPPTSSTPTRGSTARAGGVSTPTGTAASPSNPLGIDFRLPAGSANSSTSAAVRVVLGLTLLAVLPALVVCLTAFLRIIVVLSMLRQAIGMPETPPNTVLIGLALFLTLFTMAPVINKVNQEAFQPFMSGKLGVDAAYAKASGPMREFMVRQTREQDLALMVDLSKAGAPQSMDDISNVQLVPAFMLSELRAAFQIGFMIFLPFLLIDLIVASVLMALGMMMMPPVTVALPLKILMFVLVDGWSLILKALAGSFH